MSCSAEQEKSLSHGVSLVRLEDLEYFKNQGFDDERQLRLANAVRILAERTKLDFESCREAISQAFGRTLLVDDYKEVFKIVYSLKPLRSEISLPPRKSDVQPWKKKHKR